MECGSVAFLPAPYKLSKRHDVAHLAAYMLDAVMSDETFYFYHVSHMAKHFGIFLPYEKLKFLYPTLQKHRVLACTNVQSRCPVLFYSVLYTAIRVKAAVDGNDHTCDKSAGVVVRQPKERTDQIGNLTKALLGSASEDLACTGGGSTVLVVEKSSVPVGYKEAGGRWH